MKKFGKVLLVIAVAAILAVGGYFSYSKFIKPDLSEEEEQSIAPAASSTAQAVVISAQILQNKFGFLSGGEGDIKNIKGSGALWVRPHPGVLLWDSMQEDKTKEVSFEKSDKQVGSYQDGGLGMLATLWPFADWDQKSNPTADKCKVSDSDEFLKNKADFVKRGGEYLPQYRCNPNDWDAYKKWVTAVVERYDGDGKGDMEGLQVPIKYWEVMNEPDLAYNSKIKDERLNFYKQGPAEYAKLLTATSQAIREADPDAKIVIAGAAGGDSKFINFYKTVFKNKDAIAAFDIGNVHCISNDDYESFNVEPYKQMLQGLGIEKPIWVTEAETLISTDPDINATAQYQATKKALELGAQRIFFTNYTFDRQGNNEPPRNDGKELPAAELSGKDPIAAYKKITAL